MHVFTAHAYEQWFAVFAEGAHYQLLRLIQVKGKRGIPPQKDAQGQLQTSSLVSKLREPVLGELASKAGLASTGLTLARRDLKGCKLLLGRDGKPWIPPLLPWEGRKFAMCKL